MICRLPLFIMILFIFQCHPGRKQSENANARGGSHTADASNQASDRVPECTDPINCQAYQELDDDAAVAMPPTSVAGAFLTCLKAADPAFLACQVQSEKTRIRMPAAALLDWSLAGASSNMPTTALVHDGLTAGTFFYVSVPVGDIASVNLDVKEGEASTQLSFAMARLPPEDSSLQLMAMPAAVIPPSSIESTASFDLDTTLGNANVSDQNEACLGQVEGDAANQTVTKDINYADDAGKVSLYADRICGLLHSNVYMSLIAEAPAKPVQVTLVPNARRLLLFKNLDFVPGPMAFTFGYLSGDKQDAVRLGSFTFVH